MPIETKRLKLPLPLGNESVSRVGINAIFEKIDEGVATREDVEELRQLVNEMDIPDASLTQKGKVQLSSKTDGTSESVAATEKAVKEAYDRGSAAVTAAQDAQAIINNRDGFGITTKTSVYNYAVTLTPAPTALVAGLRATIMINETNTSYVHLDVNGLGLRNILKPDGSLLKANALRATAVYSVVYNGTNFILQGEGGEYGTAVAGDVRAGKTIGTESGFVTGTLPERNTTIITPTPSPQNFPAGIYSAFTVTGQTAQVYQSSMSNIPPGTQMDLPQPFIPSVSMVYRSGSAQGAALNNQANGGLWNRANLDIQNNFRAILGDTALLVLINFSPTSATMEYKSFR